MEPFTDSMVCRKCGAFYGMSRTYCPGCIQSSEEHMHLNCGCGYKRTMMTKDNPRNREAS